MRKTLIALALLLSANMFSQVKIGGSRDNFIAGLTAGGTFSQVDGDTHSGYHQFGFMAGGFVYKKINQKFDIQFDITFKQKGSRKDIDTENEDYSAYFIKLNYIELPIVARFHFWKMSAEGGISLGALISSKEGDENGEFKIPANAFKTFELGSIIGFNYYFTKKLWINMRYAYSLTPIRVPYEGQIEVYNPKENIFFNRDPGQYNNTVSLSLNYAFSRL